MQVRNLTILTVCQFISTTGSIVMVTLGGIIGSSLSANKAFATLPISLMVVAIAATAIPATMLMRHIGRRKGFSLASVSAVLAMMIAILALRETSFWLFVLAAMLFGINMAFTQQYRYAAIENVSTQHVPSAVSLVLAGSIGAAFAGRELVTRGQSWMQDVPYAGTLVVLAGMFVVQALLFLSMRATPTQQAAATSEPHRPLNAIVRQPLFVVAVLGGTVGFGLMTLIMTATPLSMHINDGYSLEQTADVIKAHVLGMYVPSLVTGFLIEKFGVTRIMFIGALGLAAVSVIGLQGHSVLHYFWALIVLGVGWNFLYIGGTTLLTYSYRESERFRAQAVNEFSVFGVSATASLLAGTVMHYFGWNTLMLIPIPILLFVAVALVVVRNDPLLQRKGSVNG